MIRPLCLCGITIWDLAKPLNRHPIQSFQNITWYTSNYSLHKDFRIENFTMLSFALQQISMLDSNELQLFLSETRENCTIVYMHDNPIHMLKRNQNRDLLLLR